ncbi:MAG: ABC transporter ATP-binding protein [Candidatus Bathyarchaeota archaeon]|nr:ABC transporter ATP-binding protein [Candidatus Bathyarchaeota archaeon]
MNKIISVKNLVKTFEGGHVRALNGVNLEVSEREFIAIMGPSGCGKSTLLHVLGGLESPTSGEVSVAGVDLCKVKKLDSFRSRKIGFIFQLHNLIPVLTARENVQVPMFELKLSSKERNEKAEKLLRLVGLENRMDFVPPKLSGGQRQKVAIARALANDPRILLVDEPTGNLDSASGHEIIQIFERLNKDGRTIVLVTHDKEIAEYASIIYHMKDGQILEK